VAESQQLGHRTCKSDSPLADASLVATRAAGIVDQFPFEEHVVASSMFGSESIQITPQLTGKIELFRF